MARLNECILYRNFEHGEILDKMAELMNAWEQKAPDLKERKDCSLNVPTDWWKLPALMVFPEIYGTVI